MAWLGANFGLDVRSLKVFCFASCTTRAFIIVLVHPCLLYDRTCILLEFASLFCVNFLFVSTTFSAVAETGTELLTNVFLTEWQHPDGGGERERQVKEDWVREGEGTKD